MIFWNVKGLARLLVCGFLLLVTSGLALGANPADVPPDHWAYQAVKQLIDQGYLQLYQDQTFKGDQPVDRYTLASVVVKILKEIASGGSPTNRDDVKVLRELTSELRQELVKIIADTDTYSSGAKEMKKNDVVLKEDLIKAFVAIQNVNAEQAELQAEVKKILDDLTAMSRRVAFLEQEVAQLKAENKKHKLYLIITAVISLFAVAQ
jgi:uncharacterized small protein (DUF1192 family)